MTRWHTHSVRRTLLVLVCGMAALSAAPRQAADDEAVRDGVRLMRMLNSAQAEIARTGQYAELPELLTHPMVTSRFNDFTLTDEGADWHGYGLSLVKSGDGGRYRLSLVPAQGCGPAWFSSELGVIYTGQALGCR